MLSFVDSCKDLVILVDMEFKLHVYIRSIVGKSSGMSVNLQNSTLWHSKEFMLTLYISHIRSLLEFGSCIWNLWHEMNRTMNRKNWWFGKSYIPWKISNCFWLREGCSELSSNTGKYSTVNVGYVRRIYIFSVRSSITRGHRFEIAHEIFPMDC